MLFDPRGDVVNNVLGNIARSNVVGVGCGTCAFEEKVIELWIALKANVGALGECSLPIAERIHRHIVITLALQNQQRLFELERRGGRKVSLQVEPIARRDVEKQFFARNVRC